MDVLALLQKDHRTLSGLLDDAVKCEPDDVRLTNLAREIEKALTVHAAIEEKYFYSALRKRAEQSEDTVDVFEAYTEHELVKTLIALLKSGRRPDEKFKAEVQVLAESVKHHVKEEESTIFSLARELLDRDELEQLGATMESAKKRLMSPSSRNAPSRKPPARKQSPAKKRARAGAKRVLR